MADHSFSPVSQEGGLPQKYQREHEVERSDWAMGHAARPTQKNQREHVVERSDWAVGHEAGPTQNNQRQHVVEHSALYAADGLVSTAARAHRSKRAKHKLSPNHRFVVVLDPGHGGWDSGAAARGLEEKNITLALAKATGKRLRAAGYRVYLTRSTDRAVNVPPHNYIRKAQATRSLSSDQRRDVNELEARVAFSNAHHANVYVAMHVNSSPDPGVGGITVYYCPAHRFASSNRKLASLIDGDIGFELRRSGYRPRNWGVATDVSLVSPQAYNDYPYFLQIGPADKRDGLMENKAVSALGETLFLSNYRENRLLRSKKILTAIAVGYTRGIESYLHSGKR